MIDVNAVMTEVNRMADAFDKADFAEGLARRAAISAIAAREQAFLELSRALEKLGNHALAAHSLKTNMGALMITRA